MTLTSEKTPHDSIEMPRDETSHDVQCPHDSKKKEERIFIRSGTASASMPPLPCIPRGEALKIEPLGLGRSTPCFGDVGEAQGGNVGRLMSWMRGRDQICLT